MELDKRYLWRVGQGELDAVAVLELREAARGYARKARAENTARTYRAGQRQFEVFCEELGVDVFPGSGEVVGLYLAALGRKGYKPATIRARLSAVRRMYVEVMGERNCTGEREVRRVYEGLMRTLDGRQEQAEVLTVGEVVGMAGAWRERGLVGLRNAALVLVGFAGAFRRSELSRICWDGVVFGERGMVIDLVHSKTQQRKVGQPVVIHRGRFGSCPVGAVEAWRDALVCRGVRLGGLPVFCGIRLRRRGVVEVLGGLQGWRVNEIVKQGADLAGVQYRGVTAHSLRAGMVTALAMAGVSDRQTMERSRHRSAAMVARYVRPLLGQEMDWTGAVGL